ncbi:hypothetical protein D3C76_1433720 [compost metagenome]
MHAGNGNAHQHGGTRTHQRDLGGIATQTKREPQGGQRGEQGNHYRQRNPAHIPDDRGLNLQCRHSGVVHRDDAGAQNHCAGGQTTPAQVIPAHQPEGEQ